MKSYQYRTCSQKKSISRTWASADSCLYAHDAPSLLMISQETRPPSDSRSVPYSNPVHYVCCHQKIFALLPRPMRCLVHLNVLSFHAVRDWVLSYPQASLNLNMHSFLWFSDHIELPVGRYRFAIFLPSLERIEDLCGSRFVFSIRQGTWLYCP